MQTDLQQLFIFTSILVSRAREQCLLGRKDEARDTLRFIHNSRIVPLLKLLDEEKFHADVAHLEWKLGELKAECVP